MKIIYDFSINNGEYQIDISEIQSEISKYGISEKEYEDILSLFHEDGYIEGHLLIGMPIHFFQTTVRGFLLYSKIFIPNLPTITDEVITYIVNNNPNDNKEISEGIHQPRVIIDNILQLLSLKGLVKISDEISGNIVLISCSPKLKRMITN